MIVSILGMTFFYIVLPTALMFAALYLVFRNTQRHWKIRRLEALASKHPNL